MSNHELRNFFPSATHPAIPYAVDILSTLRSRTGPGSGNDLTSEERTALPGVAALLGCERVQSKDLSETAAQRAASVAPSRFRSALTTARRLLMSMDAASSSAASPSISSRKRRAPEPTSTSTSTSPTKAAGAAGPQPFATPKKKFKYTSGVDISALVTPHKHSPAQASPLRASVTPASSQPTPSKLRPANEEDGEAPKAGEAEEEEEERDELATPRRSTRKGKAPADAGEDGEEDPDRTPTRSVQARLNAARRTREAEGAAAFFALRPGAGNSTATPTAAGAGASSSRAPATGGDLHESDPMNVFRVPSPRAQRVRRTRVRADWTYREHVWVAGKVDAGAWALVPLSTGDAAPRAGTSVAGLIAAAWGMGVAAGK